MLSVGLVVTALLTVLTFAVAHGTQQRLLALQVRQAASALAAALPSTQTEMADALQVYTATRSGAAFERFVGHHVGPTGFASISLWHQQGGGVVQIASVGADPALLGDGQESFLAGLRQGPTLQVTGLLPAGASLHIGYAYLPAGADIVYAESAIPNGRRLTIPRSNAFSDLDFALYLGPAARAADLIEASVPTPIRGRHATSSVPFGDTEITLVGTTSRTLAGGLSAALPWIVLASGLVITVAAVAATSTLAGRRRRAEALATENERLYLEQRAIASTLQHALLPELPLVDGLEVGARYVAGTAGIDVGGDWFDVVATPDGRCSFVLGDVSGRGLRAATTMAALRFAARAYMSQGDRPEMVVAKLGRLQEKEGGDIFATALAGEIDPRHRQVRLVSAGHLTPLLITPCGPRFVDMPVTTPIGIAGRPPEAVTVDLSPGTTLVAFTDGLVERSGESIDTGLDRLRQLGVSAEDPVEVLLDRVVAELVAPEPTDDTAVLALRVADPAGSAGPPASAVAEQGR